MEHNEWINDQVREEIEDLQDTYGFDEDEALAYWHLEQLWGMLVDMKIADNEELGRLEEERGEKGGKLARTFDNRVIIESDVLQHLSALRRELGSRVLRKKFPKGWGKAYKAANEDEA